MHLPQVMVRKHPRLFRPLHFQANGLDRCLICQAVQHDTRQQNVRFTMVENPDENSDLGFFYYSIVKKKGFVHNTKQCTMLSVAVQHIKEIYSFFFSPQSCRGFCTAGTQHF